MKLSNNHVYLLFGILICVYFIYHYQQKARDNTEEEFLNVPPSFQNYRKTKAGHFCDRGLDGIFDSNQAIKYTKGAGRWFGDRIVNTEIYNNEEKAKDECYLRNDCVGIQSSKNANRWSLMPSNGGSGGPVVNDKSFTRFTKNPDEDNNLSGFCKKYAGQKSLQEVGLEILSGPTKIIKNNIKVIANSSVPFTKTWTGNYIERKGYTMPNTGTSRDRNIGGRRQLSRDEARNLCTKTNGCEHIITGKIGGRYAGLAQIESPQYFGNARTNREWDLHSKVFKYEYTVTFWLRINNSSGKSRNIFWNGGNKSQNCPSLWIRPRSSGLRFWQSSTNNYKGENWQIPDMGYRKWNHVVISLKDKQVKVYINGKENIFANFQGHPIMPIDSKFHVAKTGADSQYIVSKMSWFPMAFTPDMVRNLAFGTYPLRDFDPAHSLLPNINATLKFRNGWSQENRGENWKDVKLQKKGNLVFLDGIIKGPRANEVVASLPASYVPDRDCYFIGLGVGGFFAVVIRKTGYVYVYDTRSPEKTSTKTTYVKNSPIFLSNIRYLQNVPNTRLPGGLPYEKLGGLVVLTGGASYWANYQGEIIRPRRMMPSSIRIPNDIFTIALTNNSKLGKVRIMKDGIKTENSLTHGSLVALDGLSWSNYVGDKLTLLNGYLNVGNPWSKEVRVSINNSIVKLDGVVIKYYRRPEFKNLKKSVGCYYDDLTTYHGKGKDSISCAKLGLDAGDNFIGLSRGGECRSGSSYGKNGESVDCYLKCEKNPVEKCGGPRENTIYDISVKPELITVLPEKYRPQSNLSFACSSGDGLTRVDVLMNGKIFWRSTNFTKNKWFSLSNIMFVANPNIFIDTTDKPVGGPNSFCQFDMVNNGQTFKYCSKFSNEMTSCDFLKENKKIKNIKECRSGKGSCCYERNFVSN